jgi:hypothetical protein
MKQLEKSDLIKGEVYKHQNGNLVKYQLNGDFNTTIKGSFIGNNVSGFYKEATNNFTISCLKLATPEEKHWLEACIAANSFISYEEAVKTFVYKYYKIIENKISSNYNNNVIYSRNTIFGHFNGDNRIIKKIEIGKHCSDSTINVLYGEIGEQKVCFDMKALQPSTKEAYDAQFVVKEPEFVLPKSWCIKVNEKTRPYIKEYRQSINYKPYEIGHYLYQSQICGNNSPTGEILSLEQFKKYVLKKQLEEPKDKVLQINQIRGKGTTIIKVESSEGAIFELGDKITVFTKDSLNKGRVLTIKGFRWNNTKTAICAITEVHNKNGIGLDKIELYSEPIVKELSLLEQAKLKYPVGTKFKNAYNGRSDRNFIFEIKNQNIIRACHLGITDGCNQWLFYNNQWAKIVENFKLPETWWITIENERQLEIAKQYAGKLFTFNNDLKIGSSIAYCVGLNLTLGNYKNISNITKSRNQQITFEQFEQYVLHNGFKVGDKFNNIKNNMNDWTNILRQIIDLQYINGQSVAFFKYVGSGNTDVQCRILTKNIVR